MPTICLNMIVKNESKVIKRLLDSVYNFIDSYCICDTGSSDNTVEIIEYFFKEKNIDGKILHSKFIDFEFNRNFALKSCYGMSDYILLLDADMVFINNFSKENLDKDYYYLIQEDSQLLYQNVRLVRNLKCFYYSGLTHEVLLSNDHTLKGGFFNKQEMYVYDHSDGGCKDNKLERDKKLLLKSPIGPRTTFYLANTLLALGDLDRAINYYYLKLSLEGWDQEKWYTYYMLGKIFMLKEDYYKSVYFFLEAYNVCPDRVENLWYLYKFYKNNGRMFLSNLYRDIACKIIEKKLDYKNYLFIEKNFYSEELFNI